MENKMATIDEQEENVDIDPTVDEICDSAEETAGTKRKTDSPEDIVKANGLPAEDENAKGVKKPKLAIETEPVACQSTSYSLPSITTFGNNIVCNYKPDAESPNKSSRPYDVTWGTEFLKTLSPSFKQKKSILKKSFTEKAVKSRATFSQTTVYYFERVQSRSRRQTGGEPSGMERNHFFTSLFPTSVYDDQKELRSKRELTATKYRPVTARLPQGDGDHADLHTIQVPIELLDEEDLKVDCVKNAPQGCSCKDYCDPELCECYFNGKQCEVLKDNIPCGCTLEYCRNPNGRQEFNNRTVH